MNGFRTLALTWISVLLGNIDIINSAIQQIVRISGAELSDGGATSALIVIVISVKMVITDAIPKIKSRKIIK